MNSKILEFGAYIGVAGIVGINLQWGWANIIGKILLISLGIAICVYIGNALYKWVKGQDDSIDVKKVDQGEKQ